MGKALPALLLLALALTNPVRAEEPSPATTALHQLFDDEWERKLREDPLEASQVGDARYNDRWPDASLDASARSHDGDLAAHCRLAQIDRSKLTAGDLLNFELFKRALENRIERYRYRDFLMPVNQQGGIQSAAEDVQRAVRFVRVKDYED